MRTILRCAVVLGIVVGLLAAAPMAFAAAKPETFTERWRDLTEVFTDVVCINGEFEEATISIVSNGVFHGTFFEDGRLHLTGTFVDRFVVDPVDPSLPTYTGKVTGWFGENQNSNVDNTTFTFKAVGTGSDGSRLNWHDSGHITAGSIQFDEETHEPILDDVRVEFFRSRC